MENSDTEMDQFDIDWDEFKRMTSCNKKFENVEGLVYLWNMLKRSNFYASNLLHVISTKQEKLLKRRLKALKSVQIAREKLKFASEDLISDVQAVLDFVVGTVEKKLSGDLNQSLNSVDLDDEDEVESSDDNDFCDDDSVSGANSFSENPLSPVLDEEDLAGEDQPEEELIPINKEDEEEYLCTLSRRRGLKKLNRPVNQVEDSMDFTDANSESCNVENHSKDKENYSENVCKKEVLKNTRDIDSTSFTTPSIKLEQLDDEDLTEKVYNNNILPSPKSKKDLTEKVNNSVILPSPKSEKDLAEKVNNSVILSSPKSEIDLAEKVNNNDILPSPKSENTKIEDTDKLSLSPIKNVKEINSSIKFSPTINKDLPTKSIEMQINTETINEKLISKPIDEKVINSEVFPSHKVKIEAKKQESACSSFPIPQEALQLTEESINSPQTMQNVTENKKDETNQKCNVSKQPDKVECPICGQMIRMKIINKHLDICTGHTLKKQSLRNSLESDNNHISLPLPSKRKKPRLISQDRKLAEECHGIESVKSALERSLQLTHVVKTSVAEKAPNVLESIPEIKDSGSSGSFAVPFNKPNSPKKHILTFKRSLYRTPDPSGSEEEDEEDIEIFVPPAPTRKSSRSSRSKVIYKEVDSDSSDDDLKKVVKMKRTSLKKRNSSNNNDGDFEPEETMESDDEIESGSEFESETSAKSNNKMEKDEKEEGEVGVNDVDVEKLLSKKFHKYDADASMVANNNKFYETTEDLHPDQPKLLTGGRLRDYQVTGYEWLKILFENGENGILADEMGLGKTIQSISMICKLVASDVRGPFLVCAPVSTIKNWFEEFRRFAPSITVLLFHGTAPERIHLGDCLTKEVKMKTQVVVITSYELVRRDLVSLKSYNWSYLVLDEGQRIKNLNSKTLKSLKTLSIQSKLMLTGTPLQNNVMELWALLNFLLPQMFDNLEEFESAFDMNALQSNERMLSMLHQILTPFVLRRVKTDVDLKIPQKREILVKAPLAKHQEKLYRATVDRSIHKLLESRKYYNEALGVADPDKWNANSQESLDEEALNAPRKTRSQTQTPSKQVTVSNPNDEDQFVLNITLNNMMMQLRKCCNHPYLIQYPIKASSDQLKEIVFSCGKMMLLDRMLPPLKKRNHKVLLFSQMTSMLDILEDYCLLRKFKFVRFDGTTKLEQRYEYIEEFNSNPNIFIFLLSTRAGGFGINLTAADTVFIYDSDWNPQNDIQAQDRCHRIGQEKPVLVYRLVPMATIDQEIVERATMKRKLEKIIMHQAKFKGHLEKELKCKSISPEELLVMLQSKTECRDEIHDKNNIISDEELEILLDRSNMIADHQFSAND